MSIELPLDKIKSERSDRALMLLYFVLNFVPSEQSGRDWFPQVHHIIGGREVRRHGHRIIFQSLFLFTKYR